jgi:hypothetical protein
VHLHDPDQARARDREATYVAAVKRGRPVAAPAVMSSVGCAWSPAPNIDPASVPDIPDFLRREVVR